MANEVEITITGRDTSGPAWASAMAKYEAFKKLVAGGMGDILMPPDMNRINSSLILIKQRIQSLGIADIADTNIQPGVITGRLIYLKRLIQQAGISDLLDINVNEAQLNTQLDRIGSISETIPVNFDVAKIPVFGEVQPINAAAAAESRLLESMREVNGAIGQQAIFWDGVIPKVEDYGHSIDNTYRLNAGFADTVNYLVGRLDALATSAGQNIYYGMQKAGDATAYAWSYARYFADDVRTRVAPAFGFLGKTFYNLAAATNAALAGGGGTFGGGGLFGLGAAAAAAGGGARRGAAGFGFWGAAIGGTIGYVRLWHLALDGAFEVLVSLGTAVAAAVTGMVAMSETAYDLYVNLNSVRTVNSSLGSQIPPFTGSIDKLMEAMKYQTVEAFGGALTLVQSQAGLLSRDAPQVVTMFDDWIARLDIWMKSQTSFGKLLDSGVGYLQQYGSAFGHLASGFDNMLKADPGTAHFLLDVIGGITDIFNIASKAWPPLLQTALAIHSFYVWGGLLGGVLARLPGPIGAVGRAMQGITHNLAFDALLAMALEMERAWHTSSGAISTDIATINKELANDSASQAIVDIASGVGKLHQALAANDLRSVLNTWHGFSNIWQEMDDKVRAFGQDMAGTVHGGFMHQIDSLGNAIKVIFDPGSSNDQAAWIQMRQNISNVDSTIAHMLKSQEGLFIEMGSLAKQGYTYTQALGLMDLAGVRANDSFTLAMQKVRNLTTGYRQLSISGGILKNSVNAVDFATLQQTENVSKLVQGWDAFFSTVATGFFNLNTYESLLATLGKDVGYNTKIYGGFSQKQIAINQDFYKAANAANTQMDSLTTLANAAALGDKGTQMLTQATKDMIQTMLPAAKHSQTMTDILYALAQRGGYQGANSFKALSTWVGNTKDPLLSLQKIVDTFTTKAANLNTDVKNLSIALGTTFNGAMAQAALQVAGGAKTFSNFADSIFNTGLNSDKTRTDAQKLTNELFVLTGTAKGAHDEFVSFAEHALHMTQSQAETLWKQTLPGLQSFIDKMHGKNLFVNVDTSAQGGIGVAIKGLPSGVVNPFAKFFTLSAGGLLPGFGGGDRNLALLEDGETVVDKYRSKQYARIFGAMGIPGYKDGGIIGGLTGMVNWDAGNSGWFGGASSSSFLHGLSIWVRKQLIDSVIPRGGLPLGNGPISGSAAIAQAFAKSIMWAYGWRMSQWPYLQALWNRESGWNAYAVNPTSGAAGIPQNINGWAAYRPGDYQSQVRWGDAYISGRYGTPSAAWAHEQQFNWYDDGGWLKPGPNYMWNGTGSWEHLTRDTGSRGPISIELVSGGAGLFEKFMAEFIREFVRVKGGGVVQRAFGEDR